MISGYGHVDQHALWIQPGQQRPPGPRQRRGDRRHLRPGRDLGIVPALGGRTAVPRLGGHAAALLRLHRPAGQRQLVRPQPGAQRRHPERGLVPRGRRRRLLHSRGPDRLHRRVPRVAERERPAHEPDHRPGAAASGRARRRRTIRARTSCRRPSPDRDPLELEHPADLSPHNPDGGLRGRQPAVPFDGPGRHLDDEPGPDEEHRPQRGRADGHGQRPAALQPHEPRPGLHPVAQRRRQPLQHDRDGFRVAAGAGAAVGGDGRRERAGQPRRGDDVGRGRAEHPRRDERVLRVTGGGVAPRCGDRLRLGGRAQERRPAPLRVRDARLR